jgi:transposase, IS5 family
MARRRIGQEDLIARPEPRAAASLAELAALLDWAEIGRALAGISDAAKGEPGSPPPALFHRRRRPTHGYKAHVATDEAAGLVRGVEVTTANVRDAAELERVLPDEPGEVYADSAFAGDKVWRAVRSRGGVPRVVHTHTWGGPEALARLEAHNAAVQRVLCRIEKVFGTWKRSYGLRRMRRPGLAKAGLQVRLAAIAYNLRRTVTLLRGVAA